ncbi:MAG: hypothetical protein L0312_20015 [Acidobacteria bacterium]|nr:hypothetical protein [Acidobacteriota bacterium]
MSNRVIKAGADKRPAAKGTRPVTTIDTQPEANEEQLRLASRTLIAYTMERSILKARRERRRFDYARDEWRSSGNSVSALAKCMSHDDENDDDKIEAERHKPPRSVWLTLADFFAEEGVDPHEYIWAQFRALRMTPEIGIPQPLQLKSKRCKERWREAQRGLETEVQVGLEQEIFRFNAELEMLTVSRRLPVEDALVLLLTDTDMDFSPLLRYCLASQGSGPRFRQIARRFEAGAVLQFERCRSRYQRHWKYWLPRNFLEESTRLYKQLFER